MTIDNDYMFEIVSKQLENMSPLEKEVGYIPDFTYFWLQVEKWRRDPMHQDFSFQLTVLRMRFGRDGQILRSYKEIAEMYGFDYQTARNRAYQAIHRLKHPLHRQLWTNPLSNVWLYA